MTSTPLTIPLEQQIIWPNGFCNDVLGQCLEIHPNYIWMALAGGAILITMLWIAYEELKSR